MPRTFRRKTMADLLAVIYKANGWQRKAGESRTARVGALYNVTVDHRRNELVATLRSDGDAPTPSVQDRWKALN